MKIYQYRDEIVPIVQGLKMAGKRIGFVPTMGALHQGHLSLIRQALEETDEVFLTIFVNPTQFNNPEDLKNYPRTLDRDIALIQTLDREIFVYAPTVQDMYGDDIHSKAFEFDGLEYEMEGKFRPGHFDGVGTIVNRFFEILQPDNAYFGMKDFQQLRIVQKLVENYNIPVNIVGCEIYRESDGLAMSSRNERLKPAYREAAPFIYKILQAAKQQFGIKSAKEVSKWVEDQFAEHELLELEYFTIADENTLKPVIEVSGDNTYRAFIAVYADDIRLIDNIALK